MIWAGWRGVRLPAKTPPARALGAPAKGIPLGSTMVDVPIPCSPVGALAGHSRPNALFIERPSGLLTAVNSAVIADGLFTPFRNTGLCALYIWTRPNRADAWSPAAAKSGGIARISGKPGSIDRKEPGSWP